MFFVVPVLVEADWEGAEWHQQEDDTGEEEAVAEIVESWSDIGSNLGEASISWWTHFKRL